jgi:uncharacterized membrane protein
MNDVPAPPSTNVCEPGIPQAEPQQLSDALKRNIAAIEERRAALKARASAGERIARAITAFTGSMAFVYLHLLIYGLWIVINVGVLPTVEPFDPSFVILASEASVEAIFLSTFVLISQNHMAASADHRADLDLHIGLLTEHELTKLAGLIDAIAQKVGAISQIPEEVAQVERDVAPEAVLDELEQQQGTDGGAARADGRPAQSE